MKRLWTILALLSSTCVSVAEGPDDRPLPVPLTRPDLKKAMEALKHRTPRISLPPLSADEQARLSEREKGYEARLRSLYLADFDMRNAYGFFSKAPDANMTLSYEFKTQLFWIVSRTNNCLY